MEQKIYTGKIKNFYRTYGFIEYELGDIFFHKSDLKDNYIPKKDDKVEFKIKNSEKKENSIQAYEIVLVERAHEENPPKKLKERLIGVVKWYNLIKGYGVIETPEGIEYFLHKSNLLSKSISQGNVVVFYGIKNEFDEPDSEVYSILNLKSIIISKKRKNIAIKCKLITKFDDWNFAFSYLYKNDTEIKEKKIIDYLRRNILEAATKQILKTKQYLSDYQLCTLSVNLLQTELSEIGFNLIKEVISSYKIDENEKLTFLKSAYEKADVKYRILFLAEGLIHLSEDEQNEILQKYLSENKYIYESKYEIIKKIAYSKNLDKNPKNIFLKSAFEKADFNYQYKILFEDKLIDIFNESIDTQVEFLTKLKSLDIDRIKLIYQLEGFDKSVREAFIKSAFEKADVEYRILFLIEGLIHLSEDEQNEILQKYLSENKYIYKSTYEIIKKIAYSKNLDKNPKDIFLKSAFEKADVEYQYKILFEDKLIDIFNESIDTQVEFLTKLKSLDFDRIKLIYQLEGFDKSVREAFLKSAFEKADVDFKYKIITNGLLNDIEYKIDFLIKTTKFGLKELTTGIYAGKTYLEVLEIDIKYLHKLKFRSDNQNFYECYWNNKNKNILFNKYNTWKELWFLIMKDINDELQITKLFSTINNINKFYEIVLKFNSLLQIFNAFKFQFNEEFYKILLKDTLKRINFNLLDYVDNYDILKVIKTIDTEFYNKEFEKIYPYLPLIKRVYLWINYLNPYYNYFEYTQVAGLLNNKERRLFNKRIREYAHEKFIADIIKNIKDAKIIEETETTKKYKCTWHNIYFDNGKIQVFYDRYSSTLPYKWYPSRYEWNFLAKEYFYNKRIEDIIFTVNNENEIISILGLEVIEEIIKIIELNKEAIFSYKSSRRVNVKIIQNIIERQPCIKFLSKHISENDLIYNVFEKIRIGENIIIEKSFLFPLHDNQGNIFLVWESAVFEKSKATYVFKFPIEIQDEMIDKIINYLENHINVRSILGSTKQSYDELRKELKYYGKIIHSNEKYEIWEERIKRLLPFLKD